MNNAAINTAPAADISEITIAKDGYKRTITMVRGSESAWIDNGDFEPYAVTTGYAEIFIRSMLKAGWKLV